MKRATLWPLALAVGLSLAWTAVASAQTPNEEDAARILSGVSPEEISAANRTPTQRAALAGSVDPTTYRLGPGDVLSLEYGGKAFDAKTLVVDSEGRVRIPNLGLILVGGRTLSDARDDIVRRLRPFLPGATVDLRLLQVRTFKVYVLGQVKESGMQQVLGSARVLEAMEAAGGTIENASTRNIRILHRDGRVSFADLGGFQRTGDWSANPYLEDGDRILVPVQTEQIGVFGAVTQPAFYEFRQGDSLGTAIRLAGGLKPEARLDSVLVVRFRGAHQLDTLYTDLQQDQNGSRLALQADDRIFIRPEPQWRPKRQVEITGEIRFPGAYAIDEGKTRVSDLLRWAGGFTPQAARRNVRLERNLPVSIGQDVEFDRLSKLSRAEMTNSEYQTFRSKLAVRQSAYLIDFTAGMPRPPETDVFLRDGDRVDVSRLELAVRVDGSVRRPGLVDYEEGRSVSDYIRMAGGTTRRGNAGDARLTHAGSGNTSFARDSRRIEPGDFIWVPEKRDTSFWTVFKDVVLVAGQVATIALLFNNLSK